MNKMGFAMFIAGATVGSAAAWLFLKKRYERIAQEEIDSVKAVFTGNKRVSEPVNDDVTAQEQKKADAAKLKPDLVDYAAKLREEGYVNYTEHSQNKTKGKDEIVNKDIPYVVSPDDFGENDEYTQISLTYYSDGVLADDNDEKLTDEDIANSVGTDFAEGFHEFEDDAVYIRNDRLKCEYEILRDNRSYASMFGEDED